MSALEDLPGSKPASFLERRIMPIVASGTTHVLLGGLILLLDLLAGELLLFPILFVVPVALAAWHSGARLAYLLAVLLPAGRYLITVSLDAIPGSYSPFFYALNGLVRIAVLLLIAYLVSRTSRLTRELRYRVETLVRICAWSRTVEYRGEWLSFEEYLQRRFGVTVTHGLSPAESDRLSSDISGQSGPMPTGPGDPVDR